MSLTYAIGIIGVVAMVMCWALAVVLYLMLLLLFGFALIASIHAWRVAATGTTRLVSRNPMTI